MAATFGLRGNLEVFTVWYKIQGNICKFALIDFDLPISSL